MPPQTLADLARHIQLATGPVLLISGVGLILLSMSNRLGRIIDRGRAVADEVAAAEPWRRESLVHQLVVLRRQARMIRVACSLVILAALLVALLILLIFLGARFGREPVLLAESLFVAALLAIAGAMGFFLREITLSTSAHDLELRGLTQEWPAVRPPAE